ncbi:MULTISPECIES: hypothetical protein [unclassified Anabaena]|uniref:hypothetical protein n=1 Tax=unclassified Anabaena TaxID=2619674 RepID=UPI002B1EC554|nr:hypothetical protein [Anabaena sp. UHCC 0399]MEA5566505.1 hypothetical protein [Anabaena sp. UHCC 0399]
MKNTARKISPALFGMTLICFFLPFTKLSCQQQEVMTLTGIQLATGTSIKQPSFGGVGKREQKIPGEPLAMLAIASSIIGFATSFMKANNTAIAPAGSGAIGFILLLMLKSKIDDSIVREGQGLILVSYGLGFWLAFLLFVAATVINIYSLIPDKTEENPQE